METRSSRYAKTKKVKRKRLNVARTLVFVLFVYLIVCIGLYIYDEPVKHYEIKGNVLLSDAYILRSLNLTDYPAYISVNGRKLEKKLNKDPLIKSSKIRHGLYFTIKIEIEENTPVFVVKSTNQVCLADGTLIDYDDSYVGLPILLNSTPKKVMKRLATNLNKIDRGILYAMNDIEYKPSYNDDNQVIDEYRFLVSMNDTNMVYINGKKTKALNKYLDIIATAKITGNGVLYLDGDEDKYPFVPYSIIPKPEEVVEEVVEGEVDDGANHLEEDDADEH